MLPLAFGFSPPDIAIILVLALIVFGPKKLPEVGRQLGQALRELRKVTEELTGTMHSVGTEVESVYKPVLSPPSEYGNPYSGTSSATVEKAMTRKPYDQEPDDLMAPAAASVPRPVAALDAASEAASEKTSEKTLTENVKGH